MRGKSTVLCVFTLAVLLLSGTRGLTAPGDNPTDAKKAPGFELVSLDGRPVTLAAELKEREVMLVFWASWCPPCVASIPVIEAFHRAEQARESKTGEKRVVVLAANLREKPAQLKPFVASRGMTYRILLDEEGRVARNYGVQGIPTVFVIDRDGRIKHTGHSFKEAAEHFYRP